MYSKDNVFAKILSNTLPSEKVYEDEYTLIFKDIQPLAKLHLLAIPKAEFVTFSDFMSSKDEKMKLMFFEAINIVVKQYELDKSGYRLITNALDDGMQTIHHFHFHILGKQNLGAKILAS